MSTAYDRQWLPTRAPRWPYGWPIRRAPFTIRGLSLIDADGKVCAQGGHDMLLARKAQYEEDMAGLLTIKQLCGGPAIALDTLLEKYEGRTMSPRVAGVACADIIQNICLSALGGMVRGPIQDAYDMYVLVNGEHADCPDRQARDDWESGIDDAIEKVFEPFEKCLSADWFGRNTIDTRLHAPVDEGSLSQVEQLALSFAKDAWRVLTCYLDDNKDLKTLTAEEICEAAGVTQADMAAVLSVSSVQTTPKAEVVVMASNDLGTVLSKMKEFADMCGMEEEQIVPLIDNALDDDEGIAMSGLSGLGLGAEDREALQMFAMSCPENPAATLYVMMDNAEEPANEPAPAPVVPTEAPGAPPAAGGPAPQVAPGAKAPRAKRGAAPAPGAIPPQAFMLMREHVKMKDEDVAAVLGVSRQTYINYGKANAKVQFVPDAAQRAALLQIIDRCRQGLDAARQMIAIPGQ